MIAQLIIALLALFLIRYGKGIIMFFVELQYKRRMTKEMPGPKSQYVVGCLPEMPMDTSGFTTFLLTHSRAAVAKGYSIMRIWVGPKLVVMPLDSEAVKVITQSSTELDKGVDYKFFERWLGPSILLGSGERWHKTRKMLTPAFHFAKIEEYAEVMDEHARNLVTVLGRRCADPEVDLYHYIKLCALDTIADTAMGVQLNALNDSTQPYVKAVEKFNWLGFIMSFKPHYALFDRLLWKLSGYEKETVDALNVLKPFTQNVIKERIKVFEDERANGVQDRETKKRLNFLDLLLENYAEGNISMEHIREEVDTFMFAGHDTTAHALSWTLWCLASNPEMQERCYQELIEHFGHSDAEFHSNKVKELKYLDQCLKESMRLFAPVPMIQRFIHNEMKMGGFVIPANTSLTICPFLIHRNAKVYKNPDVFDPEHFAEGCDYPSHAYVPFSAGPRNCIGQKFALREAKMILCHLIFNFQLEATRRFEENRPLTEVVLRPELGVPVRLKRREA